MKKSTNDSQNFQFYQSKQEKVDGTIDYSEDEHRVWNFLYERQWQAVQNFACLEFLKGLENLELSPHKIPTPKELNPILSSYCGWQIQTVPAVIGPTEFFTLLSEKKFPAASFIRKWNEVDYLKEPDIFHEVFGHCPLLTHAPYAHFVHQYGKMALKAHSLERKYLFRLFWFTIEFGILGVLRKNTVQDSWEKPELGDWKIYGGGILSSYQETTQALFEPIHHYQNFDLLTLLRTPFRIDIVQPLYFLLPSLNDLHQLLDLPLTELIQSAQNLGDLPPRFATKHAPDYFRTSHMKVS
jgi:phenylalanine-4-hydroxylase